MAPPKLVKNQKWKPTAMSKAVKAVQSKEMGYKKAAKIFKVPQTTLERFVDLC